jgi:hypothetical protein
MNISVVIAVLIYYNRCCCRRYPKYQYYYSYRIILPKLLMMMTTLLMIINLGQFSLWPPVYPKPAAQCGDYSSTVRRPPFRQVSFSMIFPVVKCAIPPPHPRRVKFVDTLQDAS